MKQLLFMLLFLSASLQGFSQGKKHRIVFQMTNAHDTMQQKAFVKQLQNLKAHWPEAQIEVVLYNQGLELLLPAKSIQPEAVKKIHDNGVVFLVCENTLKNRNIQKTDFPQWVEFVPAGIAHIVERQEKGWVYIKGGF